MNILIAADYKASQSGNFGASILALARRLRIMHHNIIFAFPEAKDWHKWYKKEGFEVLITGDDGINPEKQVRVLTSIIKQYHINLIHIHFGMFHYAIVHHRSKYKDIKVVIHDHMDFGVDKSIVIQYLSIIVRSVIYRNNNLNVITVMERKKHAYLFLKKKWFVPNGLALERFISKSSSKPLSKEILGVKKEEVLCLLLGWDLKRKGLDIAIKAVKKCRKTNPNICLGIIGAGQGKASEYAEQFIARETDISSDADWIYYLKSYEDMFSVHRVIDVYVSASRREGFSYGLLEAISQNKPVVVSDIPGTMWSKKYNKSVFFHNGDADACAEAIIKAVNIGMRESNYEEVIDDYRIDKWCDQIIDIYRKIMK